MTQKRDKGSEKNQHFPLPLFLFCVMTLCLPTFILAVVQEKKRRVPILDASQPGKPGGEE